MLRILSWALYDLANQFFILNIVSLYFVRWVVLEKNVPEIFYSISFGISTLLIALLSPVLGGISDRIGKRKPFLVYLTLICVIFTIFLGAVKDVFTALVLFAIANFGCQTAVVFYNALLADLAPKAKIGVISGLGRMFGYIGAIAALYITRPIFLKSGYQPVFVASGLFFFIFALPCMLLMKDPPSAGEKIRPRHFLHVEKSPEISNFLKASFFGLCGVNTLLLFMSVYATKAFGLGERDVINLILFATFFAIAGSIASGIISDFVGHKRLLAFIFISWMACFLLAVLAGDMCSYRIIGALAGLLLGATWVVARALAISLSSKEKMGGLFGLFNLAGYLSVIAGSLFWSAILFALYDLGALGYRIALFAMNIFTAIGLVYLLRIKGYNDLR